MTDDSFQIDEPFFHRRHVKKIIAELADINALTIYLGAGATIDRTGLSWADMVGSLARLELPDDNLRTGLIERNSPLAAASVAAEIFKNRYGTDWRERLNDAIRSLLYQQPASPAGKIVERSVSLALAVARRGGTAVIVTPNYDDFVHQEIEERADLDGIACTFAFLGARFSDKAASAQSIIDLVRDVAMGQGQLIVVSLHGILRTHSDPGVEENAQPVLSEADYWETAETSRKILSTLFEDRTVLIAGASMTDAPLLNALLETTKPSGPRRLCLMRVPATLAHDAYRTELTFARRRFQHFGVEAVAVDHYMQISQFMTEIELAIRQRSTRYDDPMCNYRYGGRLGSWWREWLSSGAPFDVRQGSHHEYLRDELEDLRSSWLLASPSEPIKIEVWLRWRPDDSRMLQLWASSIGTWSDERSMRVAEIADGSPYVAVETFSRGSSLRKSLRDQSRWRSYLATPIWIDIVGNDPIPVGVVCAASMWELAESSLGGHNATQGSAALLKMHQIGRKISMPGQD